MRESRKSRTESTPRLQSPYPALQAMLPRLREAGTHDAPPPIFDDQDEVDGYLSVVDEGRRYFSVPVWAINHADLMRSNVVNWTYCRWLN